VLLKLKREDIPISLGITQRVCPDTGPQVPVPDCDEETKRRAAQLADDIERKVTTNVHIAEERGQIVPHDITEEDRYIIA